MIRVIDESALLEVDKSNLSPNLTTSVFLGKEIYNPEKFYNSSKYIEYMFKPLTRKKFENTEQDLDIGLDLLLGSQKERKFLFAANEYSKLKNNIWSIKDKNLKSFYQDLFLN